MAIRNRWRFGGGLLASLTLCVAVHSQQAPPAPPLTAPLHYPAAGDGIPAPTPPVPPPAAKRQTIEDLIAAIKSVREKKAELDRQEQALAGELKKRVDAIGKELTELGIGRNVSLSSSIPPASIVERSPSVPPPNVVPAPIPAATHTPASK